MKLVEHFLTENPCYKAGKQIEVKGLMLHSIGCPQPDAKVFLKNWNRESYRRACVHAFVDGNDGTVYQTLPWNHRGWHCGSGKNGSGNNFMIGVEMCEPSCIQYTKGSSFVCSDVELAKAVARRTYKASVELFAMLCKEFGLEPLEDGVIISHAEGYQRGIASNHGDPEHLWRQLGMAYTMDGFRADVKKNLEEMPKYYHVRKTWEDAKSQKGAYKVLKNAKACADKNNGYVVFDWNGKMVYSPVSKTEETKVNYRVRVSISDLNIRKGPGTQFAKTGEYTGIGVFTIVAESYGLGAKKGWGKLKSGCGWISLDNVQLL